MSCQRIGACVHNPKHCFMFHLSSVLTSLCNACVIFILSFILFSFLHLFRLRPVPSICWTVSCGICGRHSAGQHADGGCCLSWSRASLLCVFPLRPEEWRLCGAHSGCLSSCLSASLQPGCPPLSPQVGLCCWFVLLIMRFSTSREHFPVNFPWKLYVYKYV